MTHKKTAQSQSTYKVYIITPSCFIAHPPFFLCQATTQECHNRKEMWVPFLNPTLFCIIKKEKDLPWSTLPPVWQPGCLGHPCDPETQRESKGESRYPTPHPQRCGAQRPGKASNPTQLLLLLLHTKLILRCAHLSWETNSHHNNKKEAMLLSESWDKKDRAYLCGCMAAWHTVMSTLIKHGGHSQTSAGEGSALQARRSGPSDVSQILTGRSPHRQDTRLPLIGGNVSWVIIFVQCRQGQHCECQRQGKKKKQRARPKTTK